MKAVFFTLEPLLAEDKGPKGSPAEIMEAFRELWAQGFFTALVGARPGEQRSPEMERLQTLLEQGGGRIAFLQCLHQADERCDCWTTRPSLILDSAAGHGIRLDESYLLCHDLHDVSMAHIAGCRSILILGDRSIGDAYGAAHPAYKDFPIALSLRQALDYILEEDQSVSEIGPPPRIYPSLPLEDTAAKPPAPEWLRWLPAISGLHSARSNGGELRKLLPLIPHMTRWLAIMSVGLIGVSLGVAYLLITLYRTQPFPEIVWYLTLQFIPRPARGLLFILVGGLAIWLAFRQLVLPFLITAEGKRRK